MLKTNTLDRQKIENHHFLKEKLLTVSKRLIQVSSLISNTTRKERKERTKE